MVNREYVTIAIVGAGRVAQHYASILLSGEVKNFLIVGVCDMKKELSESLSKILKCKSYNNLSLMLEDQNPDLTIILTPSGMHYEHVMQSLNYGSNVLVEKPPAMRVEHIVEMNNLAKKKNKTISVAYQNRLNPAIQALRNVIIKGRLGKITTATIRLRWCRYQDYYKDDWHGTWLNDGGVINQQAIHHIDALNWLIGPVDSVCATCANRLNQLEAEDTIVGIIKFKNGALGTVEATTAARPKDFEASLSVVGENGLVEIGGIALNEIKQWHFVEPNKEDENAMEGFSRDVSSGYGLSHGPLLNNVIDSLFSNNQIDSMISSEDTIATTQLVHALYKSSEIREWVKLSDKPISQNLGRT